MSSQILYPFLNIHRHKVLAREGSFRAPVFLDLSGIVFLSSHGAIVFICDSGTIICLVSGDPKPVSTLLFISWPGIYFCLCLPLDLVLQWPLITGV